MVCNDFKMGVAATLPELSEWTLTFADCIVLDNWLSRCSSRNFDVTTMLLLSINYSCQSKLYQKIKIDVSINKELKIDVCEWITHFCRIRDGSGAGRPRLPDNLPGIYQRLRFTLDIEKCSDFATLWGIFAKCSAMAPEWPSEKNC